MKEYMDRKVKCIRTHNKSDEYGTTLEFIAGEYYKVNYTIFNNVVYVMYHKEGFDPDVDTYEHDDDDTYFEYYDWEFMYSMKKFNKYFDDSKYQRLEKIKHLNMIGA